ncbi:hypothetical protein [Streptosporangium sp. NBC_01756]|nr:hypothetical protein [Streptosporangium sp. NBC_01756]WSC85793.1 hypothetical protein OIE48_36400 [Streptosporangium sp. NBC_01756]
MTDRTSSADEVGPNPAWPSPSVSYGQENASTGPPITVTMPRSGMIRPTS